MVNEWCSLQRLPADTIVHDVLNLSLGIPQGSERGGDALIDDLKITSASQFFEFDQGKIRFNAGRVTIHHKSNRASRGNYCDLRIAIPVGRYQFEGTVPRTTCRHEQFGRAMLRLYPDGCNGQVFI